MLDRFRENFRALETYRTWLRVRQEFPQLKLPFIYRFEKFFRAINSVVKWLFITCWVLLTLFLFSTMALLFIGVGNEIAQYLLRYVTT